MTSLKVEEQKGAIKKDKLVVINPKLSSHKYVDLFSKSAIPEEEHNEMFHKLCTPRKVITKISNTFVKLENMGNSYFHQDLFVLANSETPTTFVSTTKPKAKNLDTLTPVENSDKKPFLSDLPEIKQGDFVIIDTDLAPHSINLYLTAAGVNTADAKKAMKKNLSFPIEVAKVEKNRITLVNYPYERFFTGLFKVVKTPEVENTVNPEPTVVEEPSLIPQIPEKDNENKVIMSEVDALFVLDMGKVMSVNKKEWGGKYDRWNMYGKIDPIELLNACERHLLTVKAHFQKCIREGKPITDLIDDDDCSEITKIATNAMMIKIQVNDNNSDKN